MDFEKRATEALENLDAPYNELLLRLRNFCMVRGTVLKQKDVDELGDIVAGYLVGAMRKGMETIIDIAKEYQDGNNA